MPAPFPSLMSGTRQPRTTSRRAGTAARRTKQADPREPATPQYRGARFYDSDSSLAHMVAEFLHEGLAVGDPAIVIATASQRTEIVRELTGRSCDAAALQRSNDLILLDAEEAVSAVMIDDKPDPGTFGEWMWRAVESVCRGRTDCRVRIFGQMVDVLWRRGERDAAVRLELLWNQFAQGAAGSLLCGYAIGHFYKNASLEEIGGPARMVSADAAPDPVASIAADTNRRRVERRRRR